MDIYENTITQEVKGFVNVLKSLLPTKKDIENFIIEIQKEKLIRLSNIHSEAKNVFPQCFIGAKVLVTRDILDSVKLVQEYNFGKQRDLYRCFTQLLQKEMEMKPEDKVVVDTSGSVTANYREILEGGYEMRLTSKIKDVVSSETEVTIEKESEKSMGSVSFLMKDVEPSNVKLVAQWMYKVNQDFSVGTEIGYKPLMYNSVPDYSISARYARPSYVISSTLAKAGFQICLFKRFAPDLGLASVINEGYHGGPAVFGLALQKNYQNSELKIFVDSQRCGGFTFQKDVFLHESFNEDRVLRLVASTLIDRQRRVRLGFGFNLEF